MTTPLVRPPQVTDWHLAGDAWIYVRRSTEEQKTKSVGSGLYQRSPVEYLKALGNPRHDPDYAQYAEPKAEEVQCGTDLQGPAAHLELKWPK